MKIWFFLEVGPPLSKIDENCLNQQLQVIYLVLMSEMMSAMFFD